MSTNKKKVKAKKVPPIDQVDFEKVFRSAPDPYLLISPAFILLSASDAYLSATMRTYEDIVGKHIFEAFPGNPNDPEGTGVANIRNAIETVLSTGKMHRMPDQKYDVPIAGTDKFAVKYWSPTHHPILDEQSNVMYVLQRPVDITEQVLNAEKIKSLEAEKEQLVIEQFNWIASHDLKEPLRKITTYFTMLDDLDGTVDPALKKYEGYVKDGIEKMSELINDVQKFTDILKNNQASVSVNLNKTMARVKQALAQEIVATGAEIEYAKLPSIMSTPKHMFVLFKNLVDNAIKFRRKRVIPKIVIGAKKKGKTWTFCVKDNGIGIDPEYHKKIFVMMQRLHVKGYEGTGMGLVTCKKIVEMSGGKIWVESKPGEGSVFFFTLVEKEPELTEK